MHSLTFFFFRENGLNVLPPRSEKMGLGNGSVDKVLALQTQGPEFETQNSCETAGIVACFHDPVWGRKTGRFLGLAGPLGEFQAWETLSHKTTLVLKGLGEKKTQGSVSWDEGGELEKNNFLSVGKLTTMHSAAITQTILNYICPRLMKGIYS